MKVIVAIAALMTLGSSVSFAADQATDQPPPAQSTGKRWAACSADIDKFCANIEKGKGKKRACLNEHTAELSDGCKASLAAHNDAKPAPSAN